MAIAEQPAEDQAPELTDPIGQQGASLMGIAAPTVPDVPVTDSVPAEPGSVSRAEFDALTTRVEALETR